MTKTQIKDQYLSMIQESLKKYSCITDAEGEAHQLTEKLLALRQANGKRKPKKEKTLFMVMSEILIDQLGIDATKSLILLLAGNDEIKCKSVYIPSVKRVEQLLGQ